MLPGYVLCTVFTLHGSNFRYHRLNNTSPPTAWLKCQLPWYISSESLHRVQTLLLALQFTNHYVHNRCSLWSLTNHVCSLRVTWWLVTVHLFSSLTGRYVVVLLLCLLVRILWYLIKMGIWERELAKKDEISTKKWKVVKLEVEFEPNINGIIE